MKEPTCLQCGQSIAHKRSDAKYCSDRCRMRYRRTQKSKELIAKLLQLCSQIPNHVVQNAGEITEIIILNEKTGKHQNFDVKTLKRLPNEELKRMIKLKKGEVQAYKITNTVKKWMGR